MQKLDPKSVWLFFISALMRWLFLFVFFCLMLFNVVRASSAAGWLLSGSLLTLLIISLVLLIGSLSLVWAYLSYVFYRYELSDNGFKTESGVIYKKYVTIPYERIQNVDIYRGIWARILGLSDLNIQTAGMSSIGRYGQKGIFAEGRLPGLSATEAEKVRDELIARAKQSRSQGL